jgi:hypothetical protein
MVTRDEATLACQSLEATIRSQRAALNRASFAQILPSLHIKVRVSGVEGPTAVGRQSVEDVLAQWETALEGLEARYDDAYSALTEGNHFADGRFKHPVDLIQASEKWSRAVAIVNEALAIAA